MPQVNPTDPLHRMENLSRGKFFAAYALLRRYVFDGGDDVVDVHELRAVCNVIEQHLAQVFDVSQTTLVGFLVDAQLWKELTKIAKDEAE